MIFNRNSTDFLRKKLLELRLKITKSKIRKVGGNLIKNGSYLATVQKRTQYFEN